jgi:hypothetical protein
MAHSRNARHRNACGTLVSPLSVQFEQNGLDDLDNGGFVKEHADDLGAALDLAIETLDRAGKANLHLVLLGEGHIGQHVRV